MKAERFAVGSAKIEQIETDRGEKNVWRPSRHPGRDTVAFAEREEKMSEKIHGENKNDRGRDAGQNAATRIADSKRGRDTDDNQTGPRQGETILKMCAERRQESCREIGIEMQIFPQLRYAEKFRADVCAAQPKRCFTPVLDLERRINLFVDDVSGVIVVNHFRVLEIPGFRFRTIKSARRQIIDDDVVIHILLEHLHVVERIAAVAKILNKPGAGVGSIAKNLTFNKGLRPRTRFRQKGFARQVGMRRERIVQGHGRRHREQAHADQRQENPRDAYACGEHRHNFVRARHSPQRKKEREQERHRQENDENLRNLGGVIADGEKKTDVLVNKCRNIVADIEDEPDRDKARDAVQINLQEIADDVAIEESHRVD